MVILYQLNNGGGAAGIEPVRRCWTTTERPTAARAHDDLPGYPVALRPGIPNRPEEAHGLLSPERNLCYGASHHSWA
jgi:hypothetical protein